MGRLNCGKLTVVPVVKSVTFTRPVLVLTLNTALLFVRL